MDAKEFDWNLSNLRNLFEPLLEAGIFKDDAKAAEEIVSLLYGAALLAQENRVPEATAAMLVAEAQINARVRQKSWLWRSWYLHMFPLWIYHVGCFFLTLYLALSLLGSKIFDIPAEALLMGAFGAELRGLYWLQRQVSARKFRPTSVVPHLTAPVIGALLGMLAYLIQGLGILVLTEKAPSSSAPPSQGNLAPLAIAFLCGFKWEWILENLDRNIFRKDQKQVPPKST